MSNTTFLLEKADYFSIDRILRMVAYGAILIFGLVGNVFVLVALKRKSKKTANDLLIINLTVSDLMFIVTLVSDIYMEVSNFSYTVFFCRVLRPLTTLLFFASIFTITAMSIERHHVITKPFQPKVERKFLVLVLMVIWLLAVIFVIPLPIVTQPGSRECVESWPQVFDRIIYTAVLLMFQYVLPLVVITVAYMRIAIYLYHERDSREALSNCRNATYRAGAARQDNIQVVKAIMTIVIFFAVCMIPNQLAWLFWEFGRPANQNVAKSLLKFSPIAGYLHSCANPVIYGTFMLYFRREFKALLSRSSLWFHRHCCLFYGTNVCNKLWARKRTQQGHRSNSLNNNINGNKIHPNERRIRLEDAKNGRTGPKDRITASKQNLAFIKHESVDKAPDIKETRY